MADTAAEEDNALATGLGLTAHIAGSMHASPHFPGAAKTEVTVAAVLVDGSGVIRACRIDGVGASLGFSREGTLLYMPGTLFPSKETLGDSYGLHKASAISQDWHTQARTVAAWCVGKTAQTLQPGDTVTSATIDTAPLLRAVLLAVENAAFLGARMGDELQLSAAGESLPGLSAGDTPGLAAFRAGALCRTLRQGTETSRAETAVHSAVPFSREGRVLCDVSLPLSSLSTALQRTELTQAERIRLESALQP